MRKLSLGFIGGGRITKIILQAFKNKQLKFDSTIVHDSNPEILQSLQKGFPNIDIDSTSKMAIKQDIVFIALHPPVIVDTIGKLKSDISQQSVLISLAPKITIEKLAQTLGEKTKIVRLIPNATSVINEGFNPICYSANISTKEKQEIFELLSFLGKTFEVSESKLEAYAIISAMAPTYFWFQWKKLCEIGEQIGLTKADSSEAVFETMNAALNTMFKSNLKVDETIDLIPVKPIGEHEDEIRNIYDQKLIGLYKKISP